MNKRKNILPHALDGCPHCNEKDFTEIKDLLNHENDTITCQFCGTAVAMRENSQKRQESIADRLNSRTSGKDEYERFDELFQYLLIKETYLYFENWLRQYPRYTPRDEQELATIERTIIHRLVSHLNPNEWIKYQTDRTEELRDIILDTKEALCNEERYYHHYQKHMRSAISLILYLMSGRMALQDVESSLKRALEDILCSLYFNPDTMTKFEENIILCSMRVLYEKVTKKPKIRNALIDNEGQISEKYLDTYAKAFTGWMIRNSFSKKLKTHLFPQTKGKFDDLYPLFQRKLYSDALFRNFFISRITTQLRNVLKKVFQQPDLIFPPKQRYEKLLLWLTFTEKMLLPQKFAERLTRVFSRYIYVKLRRYDLTKKILLHKLSTNLTERFLKAPLEEVFYLELDEMKKKGFLDEYRQFQDRVRSDSIARDGILVYFGWLLECVIRVMLHGTDKKSPKYLRTIEHDLRDFIPKGYKYFESKKSDELKKKQPPLYKAPGIFFSIGDLRFSLLRFLIQYFHAHNMENCNAVDHFLTEMKKYAGKGPRKRAERVARGYPAFFHDIFMIDSSLPYNEQQNKLLSLQAIGSFDELDDNDAPKLFTEKELKTAFKDVFKILENSKKGIHARFKTGLETINKISQYLINHHTQEGISIHEIQKVTKFSYAGITQRQVQKLVNQIYKNPYINSDFKPEQRIKVSKKNSVVITRKFGLTFDINDKKKRKERRNEIRDILNMGIKLRNKYTKILVRHVKPLIQSRKNKKIQQLFEGTEPSFIKKHFFTPFKLNNVPASFKNKTTGNKKATLKDRFTKCLSNEPFLAVREMLKRTDRLHTLIRYYRTNRDQLGNLIADKNLLSQQLVKKLSRTILGESKNMSFAYAENFIRHLRNLIFEITEFYNTELTAAPFSGNRNDAKAQLRHEVINFITNTIEHQRTNFPQFVNECLNDVLGKLNKTPIQRNDLLDDLKDKFLRSVKYVSTKKAKTLLRAQRRIARLNRGRLSNKKRKRLEKAQRSKKRAEKRLNELLGFSQFRNIQEFRNLRQARLDQFIAEYNNSYPNNQSKLAEAEVFLNEVCNEELQDLSPQGQYQIRMLDRLFNLRGASKFIPEVSTDAFKTYAKNRMKTVIRKNMKYILFNTRANYSITDLGNHFRTALDLVEKDLPKLLDNISFSKSSHSTGNDDGNYFNINYKQKEVKLSLASIEGKRKSIEYILQIYDKKNRLKTLINEGAIPLAPTISEEGPRLVLNQPFRIAIKDLEVTRKNIMGIDLGLKVFGVASVVDENNKRIAQHFLKENLLFNRFIDANRKPASQYRSSVVQRFINSHSDNFSNVKGKLVNLRKEWQSIQRKMSLEKTYQNRKYDKIQELLKNATENQLSAFLSTINSITETRRKRKGQSYRQFLTSTIISKLNADTLGTEINRLKLNLSELRRLGDFLSLIISANSNAEKQDIINNLTPIYLYKSEYNRLVRIRKRLNARMQHIHDEIVHQFAHHVVEIAKLYDVKQINFEDLRWSKHAKKQDAGHFLSSWQIHWLFSQMQETTKHLAEQYNIKVKKVNAKGTSTTCSNCGEDQKTERERRNFHCKKCKMHLDADLNAARNIAKVTS